MKKVKAILEELYADGNTFVDKDKALAERFTQIDACYRSTVPKKKRIPTIEELCPQIKECKTATCVAIYTGEYNYKIRGLLVHNQVVDEFYKEKI